MKYAIAALIALILVPVNTMAQSRPVQVELLEQLASYLEQHVEPARFTMIEYANGTDPSSEKFRGCAAAYGTYLFADRGLRIVPLSYSTGYGIAYGSHRDFDALGEFFGLDDWDRRVFAAAHGEGNSPVDVARRIRAICVWERFRQVGGLGGGAVTSVLFVRRMR